MIQSVNRCVNILRCFESSEWLGVTEISERTGLNKSTAFGIISTLAAEGLLEQDTVTGRYCLGLELFRLGNLVNTSTRRMVMPKLEYLAQSLEETVNYVRPDGSDVVYLIKKESPHSMRICTKTGQRLPMYCTAVGKAILAYLPKDTQDRLLSGYAYTAFTENTVSSESALRCQLQEVLRLGYAVEREEFETGLICVAVPVLDHNGSPVAAVSCSGPKARMNDHKILQCKKELMWCAKYLSEILPY